MDGHGSLATFLTALVALLLALGVASSALGKDRRGGGRGQPAAAGTLASPGQTAHGGRARGDDGGRRGVGGPLGAGNGNGAGRVRAPASGSGTDHGGGSGARHQDGGRRGGANAGNDRRGGHRGEDNGSGRISKRRWHKGQDDDGPPLAGTASTGKTSQSGETVAGPSSSVAGPITSGGSTGGGSTPSGGSPTPSGGGSNANATSPPGAGALPAVGVPPTLGSIPPAVALPSSSAPAPAREAAGQRLASTSPRGNATTLQRLLAGAGTGNGLSPLVGAAGTPAASRSARRSAGTTAAKRRPTKAASGPVKEISRIVERVPGIVWVALGALGGLTLTLVPLALVSNARSRRRGRLVEQLESVAATDALTGLLNRGALERGLRAELGRARRYSRPLSLVYFDVTGLKAINDVHGHATGDRLLQSIAQLFTETSRDHDLCGRMGGDECVVVLTEQGADGAAAYGERVLERLPERRRRLGLASQWGLTAGIASFPEDGDTAEQLLAAADRRLYLQRGIRIEPRSA
jgi:diguanylate cyclase (GGDEF)-like protein